MYDKNRDIVNQRRMASTSGVYQFTVIIFTTSVNLFCIFYLAREKRKLANIIADCVRFSFIRFQLIIIRFINFTSYSDYVSSLTIFNLVVKVGRIQY